MSLRSDILGWVIGELSSIDAADPAARSALYNALRQQVKKTGAFGALPEAVLPHLESAIARQEMQWLRETGRSVELPPAETRAQAQARPSKTRPGKAWRWPVHVTSPREPPGPPPGDAEGPFADHVYDTFTLVTPPGPAELSVNWTFDPACRLTAECAAIGFRFSTRAASLTHAITHLETALQAGGLFLPEALGQLRGNKP